MVAVVLVLIALIAVAVVIYRQFAHPSLEPYKSLEVRPSGRQPASLRVMFLGVTTILLDDGETAILTDGFFSRPGLLNLLFGIAPNPDRINHALMKSGITKLAAVLVAHSHHDHAMDSSEVAQRTNAVLIGSDSTANIARGLNFPENRIHIINGGETFAFGRFRISVIESPHSPKPLHPGKIAAPLSSPAPLSRFKEGGNYSYLVEHDHLRILIHASANYRTGFLKTVRADVIFFSIGRLGKQRDEFAQKYWSEVVRATGAKVIIPIHWDDFTRPLNKPLQPMPRIMDHFDRGMKTILKLAEADGVAVRLMPAFVTVNISDLKSDQ